jgi:hypothetical protein
MGIQAQTQAHHDTIRHAGQARRGRIFVECLQAGSDLLYPRERIASVSGGNARRCDLTVFSTAEGDLYQAK